MLELRICDYVQDILLVVVKSKQHVFSRHLIAINRSELSYLESADID